MLDIEFYISSLIHKQLKEEITASEQLELDNWLEESPANRDFYLHIIDQDKFQAEFSLYSNTNLDNIWRLISENIEEQPNIVSVQQRRSLFKLYPYARIIAAALICVAFMAGLYWYTNQKQQTDPTIAYFGGDVAPGANRAILTLDDGSTVNLSEQQTGIVVEGEEIKYANGNTIDDLHDPTTANGLNERMLILSTPRGGQYQIVLPDGTKVWLNTASTLTYPRKFIGKQRRVQLTGEAYFEVAHNQKQPFIVESKEQDVTVLGTHFNISAYPEDPATSTTLLEGSVAVGNKTGSTAATDLVILKPNQQAILTNGQLNTKTINAQAATGWKDNLFIFHNSDLTSIMQQISRWYDIDVDLEGLPNTEFYAEIPRDVKLSQVLTMLESTSDLKFKIIINKDNKSERRIIIKK